MKKRKFKLKIFIVAGAISLSVMAHGLLFNVDIAPAKADYAVILE